MSWMVFMRNIAQITGWLWVIWNASAALYSVITTEIGVKLLIQLFAIALLASPGLLLIAWGRAKVKAKIEAP